MLGGALVIYSSGCGRLRAHRARERLASASARVEVVPGATAEAALVLPATAWLVGHAAPTDPQLGDLEHSLERPSDGAAADAADDARSLRLQITLDGSFRLGPAEPGRYRLFLDARAHARPGGWSTSDPEHHVLLRELELVPGEQRVELDLAGRLPGGIRVETSVAQLAESHVGALELSEPADEGPSLGLLPEVPLEPEGTMLAPLEAGHRLVYARGEGWLGVLVEDVEVASGTITPVQAALAPVEAALELVDDEGDPIAHHAIAAIPAGLGDRFGLGAVLRATSDERGRVELRLSPAATP